MDDKIKFKRYLYAFDGFDIDYDFLAFCYVDDADDEYYAEVVSLWAQSFEGKFSP